MVDVARTRAKGRNRRGPRVNRGLLAMAMIVANLRASIGEVDDPDEEEDINAALHWIRSALGSR